MKLSLKTAASAHDIAVLHKHLAQAELAILEALLSSGSHSTPLKATSRDALAQLARGLGDARFDLEDAFALASGDPNAPFAKRENPDVWLEWLITREEAPQAGDKQDG